MGWDPGHERLDLVGQSAYEFEVMGFVQNMVGFFCRSLG